MSRELQRQAVKNILQEMSDNAEPVRELTIKALIEDWDEDKLQKEMGKAIKKVDLSKTFDYFTDRIMSVFEPTKKDR